MATYTSSDGATAIGLIACISIAIIAILVYLIVGSTTDMVACGVTTVNGTRVNLKMTIYDQSKHDVLEETLRDIARTHTVEQLLTGEVTKEINDRRGNNTTVPEVSGIELYTYSPNIRQVGFMPVGTYVNKCQ